MIKIRTNIVKDKENPGKAVRVEPVSPLLLERRVVNITGIEP